MLSFKYRIIEFNNRDGRMGIEVFEEKYEPVSDFFFEATPNAYPKLIDEAMRKYSHGFNESSVTFPEYFMEWEEGIPKNMVLFSIFDERVLISRIEYLELLKEMAKATLESLIKRGEATEDWKQAMERGIQKLEEYIKNPDFDV